MKVSVKEVSEIARKVHVELPQEKVGKQLEKAYRQLNRTVKVKGFRPGKVPLPILKRHYADQVHNEVSIELINETLVAALQQTGLNVVSQSDLDRGPVQEGEPFRYSVLVEVKPEFVVKDFSKIPAQRRRPVVSKEEVEAELEVRRQTNTRLESLEADRPIVQGDHVVLDFKAFADGKPVPDGEAQGSVLEVGANRFNPDFEASLVGARRGDQKDIEVTFPPDYGNKTLAGKKTTFQVEIKDIKEKILPELDDDFARSLGEFHSLEELRTAIHQELEVRKNSDSEVEVARQIMEELAKRNPIEVPQAMVEQELQKMLDTIRFRLSAQNLTLEQTGMDEDTLKEQHRAMAEKKVRETLLLAQIAEQESLQVSDEEVDKRLHDAADEANQPYEKIRDFYEKNNLLDSFRHQLVEEKALEHLKNQAEITEVEPDTIDSEEERSRERENS
jgi:trigger factor